MATGSDSGHDLSGTVSEKTGKQKYETEILLKIERNKKNKGRKLLHEELENRQTVKSSLPIRYS